MRPDLTDDFLRALDAHLADVPHTGLHVDQEGAQTVRDLIAEVLRLRILVPKD